MRIALFFPGCHRRGGIERAVLETANFLAARKHEVHLCAREWDQNELDPRVKVHAVAPARGPSPLPSMAFARESRRIAEQINPDVRASFGVHCPTDCVFWAGSVHRAWLKTSQSQRNLVGRLKQRLNPFHPVMLRYERRLLRGRRYRKVIAYTPQVKADMMQLYNVPEEDIVIIPNGYSANEFKPENRAALRSETRARLGIPDSAKIVLFVANELERKGFDPLLRAFALTAKADEYLVAVGRFNPGHYPELARKLALEGRVLFPGASKNVAEYYAAADLFALPTQYEPWGLVIIEAMAGGIPVLTSRLAGAACAVNQQNGMLLEDPREVAEIAAKMRQLLDTQHEANAISASVAQFSWQNVLAQFEQVLIKAAVPTFTPSHLHTFTPGNSTPRVVLTTDADVFAGTERHILDLAVALRRRSIDATIACPGDSPLAERARGVNIPVHAIAKKGRFDFAAARALRVLVDSGVEIIHAHNGRTALTAAWALRGANAKLVITQHFLAPAHTRRRGPAALLSKLIHHFILSRTARMIAISNAVAQAALERGDIKNNQITVIHNGLEPIDPNKLRNVRELRQELNVPENAPFIFCAARLETEKDVATLIRAMPAVIAKSADAQCLIAGRGKLHSALVAEIALLNLQNNVRLLGFRADVNDLINAADCFVLPSPAEPFGLVLLEAMSLGKPVIATRAGGPVEIVEHNRTGLLVPPSDPIALAAAISRVIENPADMGRQGRARFDELFTADIMAGRVASLYREVLGAPEIAPQLVLKTQ